MNEFTRIPILKNHDPKPENVLGTVAVENDGLRVTMKPEHAFTREELFWTFGNCGIEFSECRIGPKGETLIDQFFIKSWVAEKPKTFPIPEEHKDNPAFKLKKSLLDCAPESEVIRDRLIDWIDANVRSYSFSTTMHDKTNDRYAYNVERGFARLGMKLKEDFVAFIEQRIYQHQTLSIGGAETVFTVFVISGKPK